MLEQILQLLTNIKQSVEELPSRIKITTQQVTLNVLSELAKNLGLITAGEFRVGNGKEPGLGFTGVRIAYPHMTYGNYECYLVSAANDILQVGLDKDSGIFVAGLGDVALSSNGLSIAMGSGAQNEIGFIHPAYSMYGSGQASIACSNSGDFQALVIRNDINQALNAAIYSSISLECYNDSGNIGGNLYVASYYSLWNYTNYLQLYPTADAVNSVRLTDKDQNVILSIDTTNNRVGINTDAPQDTFHVIGGVLVEGDSAGYAGTVGLTNVVTGISGGGHGTVEMNGATGRDSTGWLKIMDGTTAKYIPFWTAITG
jgi:hypothetical protein